MKKWTYIFYAAALWNFSAALKAFSDIEDNAQDFYLASSSEITPILISNLYIFWWTVLTFGIGYLIVAVNPARNHGLVFIAILGKVFVGWIWVKSYLSGSVNQTALMGGIGDIIFALAFALFLYKMRGRTASKI